jgi:prolipoprotein diacylglyceryl transferase
MYPRFSDLINDFLGTNITLPVQTYGFFVAMAFVFGGIVVYFELKRKEREKIIFPQEKVRVRKNKEKVTEIIHPKDLTSSILLVAAIFGIIGAKLFDVIEHLDQLVKDPVHTLLSFSGLAFYGGLITAAVAVSLYVERNKIPWHINADVVAPALMLAYGIGRIGCQLSGDGCWGMLNTEPKPEWLSLLPDWMWAFNYPHNVINEGILIPGCEGKNCHMLGQPVFPTPFYETVIAFLFFGVLMLIRKRLRIHGFLFSTYMILNGIERLLIEQLRVNIHYDFLGMKVTQAEFIAVGLILAGLAGFYFFRWKWKRSRWK